MRIWYRVKMITPFILALFIILFGSVTTWRCMAGTEKGWCLLPFCKQGLMCQNAGHWLAGRCYARHEVAHALESTAVHVNKKYPGSWIAYLDASRRHEGTMLGHLSHRAGKDVDVLLFGKCCGLFQYPKWPSLFIEGYLLDYGKNRSCALLSFDAPRNWELLMGLKENGAARVERIFVEPYIKEWLIEEGKKHNAPKGALAWVENTVAWAGPTAGDHKDHMHVRFTD